MIKIEHFMEVVIVQLWKQEGKNKRKERNSLSDGNFSLINFNCLAFCNRLTFLLTFLFDLWHFIALSWSKWQFHHDNDYLGSKKSIGPRDFADFSSPKLHVAYMIQHQAGEVCNLCQYGCAIWVPLYLTVLMLWCL